MASPTEPEQQQQWTGLVLSLVALLQLLLVHLAYRVDRAKRAPLVPTATWAMVGGVVLGFLLSWWSPQRARREGLDPQVLFFGLLPPILVDAGFNTQRKGFFSNFAAIGLLAVVGTLVATVATGVFVYMAGRYLAMTALPLAHALLVGALLSAIDPVATLVVLQKSRAPPLLFHLLFGESVLNDAIVLVVFGILQQAVLTDDAAAYDDWWVVRAGATLLLQLVGISVGSVLVAAAVCYTSAYCLRHADAALRQHPTYEIAALLLSAYTSFVVCQSLALSGLLAVFVSGVLLRHYHVHNVSRGSAAAFKHLLSTVACLAENSIFLYLGVSLVAYADQFCWDWVFVGVSLAAALVARALSTFPLCALANAWRTERIPWKHQLVLWLAGLRGAIAFALALNVRTGRADDPRAAVVRAATLVTVLVTTTVCGAATGPLVAALGLANPHEEPTRRAAGPTEAAPLLPARPQTPTDDGISAEEDDADDGEDRRVVVEDERRWGVRRLWVHVDERHLKPIFGGKPRPCL